MHDEQVY